MRHARTGDWWWPLLGLLAILPACVAGAETVAPPKGGPPPGQPQLSPDQQAANDLIERFKTEAKVKQERDRHLAEQHFRAGKAHFDLGAWKLAHERFEKAVGLDPTHQQAQEYLRRAAGLLGLKEGRVGLIDGVIAQEKVRVEALRIELLNLFEQAKAAYRKGQFLEAVELFTRVKAKAQYLAPYLDTAKVADGAERGVGESKAALGEQRSQRDGERLRRAVDEAEQLRRKGQSLLLERQQAQLAQALSLFHERRYDQARKLCDQVLRQDPTNAVASTLRDRATRTARTEAIDRVLRSRAAETDRCMQQLSALTVPQNDIVSLPRERLEALRQRKGRSVFDSGRQAPEEWERRIRESFERKVTFDFVETPLSDVVSFLGSLTEVSMVLDTEALKGAMPNVSLRVQDMRLEAALNWICQLVGLRYALRDEAVFISRPERIYDTPVLRMYDVTDLTIEIKNFKGRHRALATDTGWGQEGGFREFFEDEDAKDKGDEPLSGAELVEFLKQIVAPTGPNDDGGLDRLREVVGLPRDDRPGRGQELVDLIGVTIGGRTFLGVKTKE